MEWALTMTQREGEAVIQMLDTCEEPIEVEAERAEGTSEKDTSQELTSEASTPTLVLEEEPQESNSVYGSCEEAVEAMESRVKGGVGGGRGFPRKWYPDLETRTGMVLYASDERRGQASSWEECSPSHRADRSLQRQGC